MMAKPAGLPVIAGRYPDEVTADSGLSEYSSVQADQMKRAFRAFPTAVRSSAYPNKRAEQAPPGIQVVPPLTKAFKWPS